MVCTGSTKIEIRPVIPGFIICATLLPLVDKETREITDIVLPAGCNAPRARPHEVGLADYRAA